MHPSSIPDGGRARHPRRHPFTDRSRCREGRSPPASAWRASTRYMSASARRSSDAAVSSGSAWARPMLASGCQSPSSKCTGSASTASTRTAQVGDGVGISDGARDHELVAAVATDLLGGPHSVAQAPGHDPEHLVAGVVAVAVVDLLEPVEVDEQDAEVALAVGWQRRLEVLVEGGPVEQAGQRIGAGPRLQLHGRARIDEDADHPATPAAAADRAQAERQRAPGGALEDLDLHAIAAHPGRDRTRRATRRRASVTIQVSAGPASSRRSAMSRWPRERGTARWRTAPGRRHRCGRPRWAPRRRGGGTPRPAPRSDGGWSPGRLARPAVGRCRRAGPASRRSRRRR